MARYQILIKDPQIDLDRMSSDEINDGMNSLLYSIFGQDANIDWRDPLTVEIETNLEPPFNIAKKV